MSLYSIVEHGHFFCSTRHSWHAKLHWSTYAFMYLKVYHKENTCAWTQQLSHCCACSYSKVTLLIITPPLLNILSFLTVNAANQQLACLLGLSPPLYTVGAVWASVALEGEILSLGRIRSWHVTLTFPCWKRRRVHRFVFLFVYSQEGICNGRI